MKKVTVITLQNVRNYGSVLQAVATQKVFEDLGCQVDFINYVKDGLLSSKFQRIKLWVEKRNIFQKVIYGILLYPTFVREDRMFPRFLNKYLNQQDKVYGTEESFKKIKIDSDIYCTGSDQVWNSGWNGGILKPLFLSFVPDNVKKIAYSASFGKPQLDDWEKEETRKLLQRYSAISVREKSAVNICEDLGLPSVTHVLDPTLQVNKDFWMSLLTESQRVRTDKGKYVLVYQLNSNREFDRYAKEFAKRKGWKLVRFCLRYDQIVRPGKSILIPEVTDFISLIANAGCVITDSFHGTAFCCNLNTPMICIYPNEFSSRLASLLQLTGLEQRHLKEYNDFSYVEKTNVDFERVNSILNQERAKGVVGKVARIAGQQRIVVEISGLCLVATAYIPTDFIEIVK